MTQKQTDYLVFILIFIGVIICWFGTIMLIIN